MEFYKDSGLPDELIDELNHCCGLGCTCHAWYEDECVCGADWRGTEQVLMDWMISHPDTRHQMIDTLCDAIIHYKES